MKENTRTVCIENCFVYVKQLPYLFDTQIMYVDSEMQSPVLFACSTNCVNISNCVCLCVVMIMI